MNYETPNDFLVWLRKQHAVVQKEAARTLLQLVDAGYSPSLAAEMVVMVVEEAKSTRLSF